MAVILREGCFAGATAWTTLDDLVDGLREAEIIAVDIPIGLPDGGPREADLAARAFVGPRRSSVFPAPPRAVLEAPSYAEAVRISRQASGSGISQQSWALRSKILEADAAARSDTRLREAHPEVTFCAMAGEPLKSAKRTWNGQAQRRALLESEGITLPNDLGPAGAAPVDDILDAAACAWTALRIATGTALALPPEPSDSAPCIWY